MSKSNNREDMSKDKDKSDEKVVKNQRKLTKDSDNKDKNAANAKENPGHYDDKNK